LLSFKFLFLGFRLGIHGHSVAILTGEGTSEESAILRAKKFIR